ncbi:MAG: 50S ribosomal protein L18Ae [Candidatus Micrarchaeota archaeon]
MKYAINGEMNLKGEVRKFARELEAPNEKTAVNNIYAYLGSKHRLKRGKIKVVEVKKV